MADAASPDIAVVLSWATSLAFTPNCAARNGSILKVIAGPLTTTPLKVSSTPCIFLNELFDFGGFFLKGRSVLTKELDLDWFWRTGEIANHIWKNTDELHIQ
jgi:hypothetical protein